MRTDITGSLHSEQTIISAVVQHPDLLDTVLDLIDPSWVGGGEASQVMAAILALAERRGPLDPGSIIVQLGAVHDAVIEWVWTLPTYSTCRSRETLAPHAEIVRQGHIRRWLAAQGRAVSQYAADTSLGADEAVEAATNAILSQPGEVEAARTTDLMDAARVVITEAQAAMLDRKPSMGLVCGVSDLDRIMRGVHPSRLYVIGAATGAGKTAWMVWHAYQVTKRNPVHAIYVSVEVPAPDLARRIITSASGVPSEAMLDGTLDTGQVERMVQAVRHMERGRLGIVDHRAGTIGAVRTAVKRYLRSPAARTVPLGAVYVDYIQRFRPVERGRSREEEVAAMSGELWSVAREYKVPVIVGAQLNRELYKRAEKKPAMADLRESAALEQDANMVIFLHRPEMFEQQPAGVMQAIVAKNREGRTGTVDLSFDAATGAIAGLAREEW